jgi:thiol-disulfide isomerase/thioredoxin
MIEYTKECGEITAISLNGEALYSDDGASWHTPKSLLKGIKVEDLPEGVSFEMCEKIQEGTIFLDSIPVSLSRIAPGRLKLSFEDRGTRKYWDGKVGFSHYMETKKAIVEERQKEDGDISLDSYDDDGAYIFMHFSTEIDCDTCDEAVQIAEQIANEIEGAAELRIGVEMFKVSEAENEKEFTLRVVLPILRKLGFSNVKYNHGKREFGKDIVFSRLTEFDDVEHWAAQVKYGDVSGGANSEIDEILSQIEDAFKMPFYDLYTKARVRPSKVCVIISGKFTENAIEKICEKIESHAMRNNVVFVDGSRIDSLSERFRRR